MQRICVVLFLVLLFFSCKNEPTGAQSGLQLLNGFKAEKLFAPSDSTHGSWVSLAHIGDDQFVASDQYGLIYRVQIPEVGSDKSEVRVSPLEIGGFGKAQGLLWAFESLYVMVNDRNIENSGLYRLMDSNGDDLLDSIHFIQQLDGWGEHGPHAVIKGPDDLIYVIAGNHTKLPEEFTSRQPAIWEEDNLHESIKDPNGHAVEIKAPGGWIARTDAEGSYWEVYSSGYRNPYDIAFNEHGDLFTFDSDMEWDLGLPWYRPVRISHATSGSEYGWRTGSGKWPVYYPDNLPGVHDVGQGSPTGVISALNSSFPSPFDQGLFICDWSFGTMYHVELSPQGASYSGQQTEFLSGIPLPLTDVTFDDKGVMYFTTGGRRLESGLYRVWYDGPMRSSSVTTLTVENQLRRTLESFHDPSKQPDLNLIWNHLSHTDRFVRYSARIAMEQQGIERWRDRLATENQVDRLIAFGIAAARTGNADLKSLAFDHLRKIKVAELDTSQRLDLVRAQGLLIIRSTQLEASLIENQWTDLFPVDDISLNLELARLFSNTQDPSWLERTNKVLWSLKSTPKSIIIEDSVAERSEFYGPAVMNLRRRTPAANKIALMDAMSRYKVGWNPNMREDYFTAFNNLWDREGGFSYRGFIQAILENSLATIPENHRAFFRDISGSDIGHYGTNVLADLPVPEGPGRNWTVEEVVAVLDEDDRQPDLVNGAKMFEAALCQSCHVFQGKGGNTGPALTQLGTRFTIRDMARAIIIPNDEITDQYAISTFQLMDNTQMSGRMIKEENDSVFIMANPLMPENLVKLSKSEIASIETSDISWMFPALLNRLNEQEVYDLMSYLKGQ